MTSETMQARSGPDTATAETAAPDTRPERVPAEAEDFAHVLRRLVLRRAAQREAQPGLYR